MTSKLSKRPAVLIGIAASVALLMLPALLWAHARLKKSEPKASAQLAAAPRAIALWFTERPELAFSRIALVGPDSTSIALGALARTSDSTFGVVATIQQPLGPGRYVVDWTTASTDGHPVRGRFSFVILGSATVGAPTSTPSDTAARRITAHIHDTSRVPATRREAAASASATDASSPLYVLVRWLSFSSLIVLVGVVAFKALVLREFLGSLDLARRELADHLRAGSAMLGIVAASVLVASALARLVTQSVAMHGEFSVSLSAAMLVHSSWGASWLLQTVGALVALLALSAARGGSRAGWLVASGAALVLATTPALSGHALASPRLTVLAVIADAVHVLGAGIWLGSLLTLLVVGLPAAIRLPASERGPAAADLVNAFSTTALAGAALLVATGVFAAWLHLGSFSALWRSSYGRVLIAKLAVLCALIATGAYNWRRVRPAMSEEVGPRRLRRSATLELVVGAIVIAITALLVALPTPVDLT